MDQTQEQAPAESKKPNLAQACPAITASILSEANWLFERMKNLPMSVSDHERAQRSLGALIGHVESLEKYIRSP